jgi:diguanylate cyclase (GGDEF)-like protein
MPEQTPVVSDRDTGEAAATAGYAPYGQLVKMLLPSAGSIAIYDAAGELVWCSDGYERPDLRALLESIRGSPEDTLSGRGNVEHTGAGVPAFVAGLKGKDGTPLGALVLELSQGQSARYSGSMVSSLLRPVLDTLESRMNLERTILSAERDDAGDLELLLSVDAEDREDATALEQLLRHCVQHLNCALGAFLIPDKNLMLSCSADPATQGSQLLDRTQKHLLAWAQLNNRPMVVNRVGVGADIAPYKILSCPVRDPHNRVMGLIALFRAASAEDFELRDVRILEFVSRKAVGILSSQYDVLTGLINRLIFERRLQSSLDGASGRSQALLYLDVDKLQAVNEAFGFQAGDEVIQRVAEVIRTVLAPNELASRVGGDRFAVFLQRDAEHAVEEAKRILTALSQLGYTNGERSVPVSASIGVAVPEESRALATHLLASAELACKRAKHQGRNRLEVHSADNGAMLIRRRQLFAAANLQEALKNNSFRLETQAIMGLRTRAAETVGYEVLVRMRGPEGELLAPDKFIEAAERYELMPAIDRWVLCSTIDVLREEGAALDALPYYYTINVSAQSLNSRQYATFAREQLAAAGLPPSAFCFEIKEAIAVTHIAQAEQFILELSAAGCKIALDDFGCGLSSLAHLKRLPVQYLKIDGRFVRRILEDRVAESIVSGITKAAKTLGVGTIAEHVENEALALKLRELEVDFGQGFFLGVARSFSRASSATTRTRSLRTTGA